MDTSDEEIGLILAKMPDGEAADMLRAMQDDRKRYVLVIKAWAIIAEKARERADEAERKLAKTLEI